MSRPTDPATLVAEELRARAYGDRGVFLRELLAHTAAGLVVLEDSERAAEAVYRLADAVVARQTNKGAA